MKRNVTKSPEGILISHDSKCEAYEYCNEFSHDFIYDQMSDAQFNIYRCDYAYNTRQCHIYCPYSDKCNEKQTEQIKASQLVEGQDFTMSINGNLVTHKITKIESSIHMILLHYKWYGFVHLGIK